MILGIGIDLCDVVRMRQKLGTDPGFVESVFLPGEIAYCRGKHDPAQHFAARFAAKEALLKSLADAPGSGSFWHDAEVVRESTGKPGFVLAGRLAGLAARLDVARTHLSLSHTPELAVASVVLEGDPTGSNPDPSSRRQR